MAYGVKTNPIHVANLASEVFVLVCERRQVAKAAVKYFIYYLISTI